MKNITENNFTEILQSPKPVLVKFTAEWCAPCKSIALILSQLEKEFGSSTTFAEVDVDNCPELAMQYDVIGVPTLILFKNGKLTQRMSGSQSKHKIIEMLKS